MPRRNTLAAVLAADGRHRYQIGAAARINPSALSAIQAGRLTPSPDQRRRLAAALNVTETDLFPDTAEVSA